MSQELVDFGKHAGTPWTRIPVAYLRWMISAGHTRAEKARQELERRGITTTDRWIQISAHAIDRASQRRLECWQEHRIGDEGLHAFLLRACEEAIDGIEPRSDRRYHHRGMVLVIERSETGATLVTVL